MTAPHLLLGRRGESRAERWYRRRGWHVLARNWRTPTGELDLVLARRGRVVFCEVKTRSSRRRGDPVEAVDADKQRRLRLLGAEFLRHHELAGVRTRFDIAEVLDDVVRVRRSVL